MKPASRRKNATREALVEADGRTREAFAADLLAEWERRRAERKTWELQWQLNMNFVAGNQSCRVTSRGDIADEERAYEWQERAVYNHIAPIVETRLAKLSRIRPEMSVVPAGGEDGDLLTARTATAVLDCVADKLQLSDRIAEATAWAESCGTVFYKIVWDGDDAAVTVVPPFEIYPDRSGARDLADCRSLIHARAVPKAELADAYGLHLGPDRFGVLSPEGAAGSRLLGAERDDCAVLLEYYERPTRAHPEGRYAVVAGGELVALSSLPYRNGVEGARDFPFVRQTCIEVPGAFWGTCVVERSIPVQRAYNAVKNRKHEFLDRLAGGVLAVEDGSVDADELAQDGLNPGKILIYRRGTKPPEFLDAGHLPTELAQEEERLLDEFIAISGVSELMRSGTVDRSINSGYALQLLIDQDDTRLAVTAESVKSAVRRIAAQILRLYKQFATTQRMARVVGKDGAVELTAWSAADITSDEVVFVSDSELSETPASRRQFVLDLLGTGLLADADGKLSERTKARLLEMIGFGVWEGARDAEQLQRKRAIAEQSAAPDVPPVRKPYDDDAIHAEEHVKYLLGGECARRIAARPALEDVLVRHLEEHRKCLRDLRSAKGESNAKK